jgi:hypothetical protein
LSWCRSCPSSSSTWHAGAAEKPAALAAYARQRGFRLSDEVIGYLLAHRQRDMTALLGALEALDRHSLATRRPITIPLLRQWLQSELGPDRRVKRRFDVGEAVWRDRAWYARNVDVRTFDVLGNEAMEHDDSLKLDMIRETPVDFASTSRPVEETSTRALRSFISRMKRAGENVAKEEVEYYYRFSYSLIGLVVVLLGLPLSVRLRRGGVMFGLGLGLLLSFLYWGAIQTSRAFGTSHVISTVLSAWLPNMVFGAIALALVLNVDR